MAEDEHITISMKVYKQLLRDSRVLEALEAGGVENWEWYNASLEDYRDAHGDQDE